MPIPKQQQKSLICANNYRGIVLSSIVGKLFDMIIVKQNINIFTTGEFQFDFKQKHSTCQCTLVLNEVMEFYGSDGCDMYIIFLDYSKVFDWVDCTKLISLLINQGLCSIRARLLANLCTVQKIKLSGASLSQIK